MSDQARREADIEAMARAIWHAQWDEPWPREGGVEHVHAMQIAQAAYAIVSDEIEALRKRVEELADSLERDMTGGRSDYDQGVDHGTRTAAKRLRATLSSEGGD